MNSCKKCKSKKLKKIVVENLSDDHLDNVIEVYKCQDCGHEEKEVVHIG